MQLFSIHLMIDLLFLYYEQKQVFCFCKNYSCWSFSHQKLCSFYSFAFYMKKMYLQIILRALENLTRISVVNEVQWQHPLSSISLVERSKSVIQHRHNMGYKRLKFSLYHTFYLLDALRKIFNSVFNCNACKTW